MQIRFDVEELKELAISAVVLGFCFAWIQRNYLSLPFIEVFLIMLIAVGVSFIAHELAHKATAQRYGHFASYRMWDTGLIIAFFLAVTLGAIFAAPGAVYISAGYYPISRDENGIISLAGPATNLALAVLFLVLSAFPGFLGLVGGFGFFINLVLALFNLLPFPPLDGSKILRWNSKIWAVLFFPTLIIFLKFF